MLFGIIPFGEFSIVVGGKVSRLFCSIVRHYLWHIWLINVKSYFGVIIISDNIIQVK